MIKLRFCSYVEFPTFVGSEQDGVVASSPNGIAMCQVDVVSPQDGEDGKMKDMMIGVDLAKNVFQLHGASMTGNMKSRKKLSRGQFLRFMSQQPPALVIMEACGSAHFWARELVKVGHEVKLIAPQYCALS